MENFALKLDCALGLGPARQGANSRSAGQATVEFILTLVVALLIITVIILPSYDNSSNYVLDVSNLAKLRVSSDKLVDALQYVHVSGKGAKQTLEIVIPQNATITCDTAVSPPIITMRYGLLSKQSIPSCLVDDDEHINNPNDGQSCTKKISVFPAGSSPTFSCAPGSDPVSYAQGLYLMSVQKDSISGALSIAGTKIG